MSWQNAEKGRAVSVLESNKILILVKKAVTLEVTECEFLGGKRSFLISIKDINKHFFPDLLVGFLFENKGHGFTIAFLCRRMGWIITTGIFLREGVE